MRICVVFVSFAEEQRKKEGIHDSNKLVIGLHPPIGKESSLAKRFIDHAAKFQPRILVVVIPYNCEMPLGYAQVFSDYELCSRSDDFYKPGEEEQRQDGQKVGGQVDGVKNGGRSRKLALKILVREDVWNVDDVDEEQWAAVE